MGPLGGRNCATTHLHAYNWQTQYLPLVVLFSGDQRVHFSAAARWASEGILRFWSKQAQQRTPRPTIQTCIMLRHVGRCLRLRQVAPALVRSTMLFCLSMTSALADFGIAGVNPPGVNPALRRVAPALVRSTVLFCLSMTNALAVF